MIEITGYTGQNRYSRKKKTNMNNERFREYLKTAVEKAGSIQKLMDKIGGAVTTYINWSKYGLSRIDNRNKTLLNNLATYLELESSYVLFDAVLPTAPTEENIAEMASRTPRPLPKYVHKTPEMSDIERLLATMEKVKELRKKYTWETINFWLTTARDLNKLVKGDWNGMQNIIDKMRPQTGAGSKKTIDDESTGHQTTDYDESEGRQTEAN